MRVIDVPYGTFGARVGWPTDAPRAPSGPLSYPRRTTSVQREPRRPTTASPQDHERCGLEMDIRYWISIGLDTAKPRVASRVR